MELNEIFSRANVLENLKKPEIRSLSSVNSLDGIGSERIESLKNAVHEIKNLIEERKTLSNDFIKEGDEIKLEISNFLLENKHASDNISERDFLMEKTSLRNKKIEISELQLNEKINCWKDIALLKKELRENEKELTEKQSRLNELNDLLKEN